MAKFARIPVVGVLAMSLALSVSVIASNAQTVKPLVVDLATTGRGISQVISVENTSANAMPVELTVQEILVGSHETTLTGADPGEVIVFPPQATVQPGQTQSFRLQYVGDPNLAKSKHYYVTVAQVPVAARTGVSGVQVVFNFQVLASVGPPGAKPALRVHSAKIGEDESGKPVPVVTMANDSATYGYLSRGRLRVIERDAAGREVFRKTYSGPELGQLVGMGLISSGQQRQFILPSALPVKAGSIEASFTPDS